MREKLKQRRKEMGYKTQKEFADALGISVRTYQPIEQGLRMPHEQIRNKIMNLLKTNSLSLFDDNKTKKRGEITKNICKYMNTLSENKKFSTDDVNYIRRSLEIERKDRFKNNLNISSKTKAGKAEINKRAATVSKKVFSIDVSAKDIEIFKKSLRIEFTDRTGKCIWGIPEVRKKLGYNPNTGY